jgi:hypothetical protein
MLRKYSDDEHVAPERPPWVGRLKLILLGSAAAIVLGIVISLVYTSSRYGDSVVDQLFRGEKAASPNAGKNAYDKRSNAFLGVIRSEGYSTRRRTNVYYIEGAGGNVIEVPRDLVIVRERSQ